MVFFVAVITSTHDVCIKSRTLEIVVQAVVEIDSVVVDVMGASLLLVQYHRLFTSQRRELMVKNYHLPE